MYNEFPYTHIQAPASTIINTYQFSFKTFFWDIWKQILVLYNFNLLALKYVCPIDKDLKKKQKTYLGVCITLDNNNTSKTQ